MAHKHSVRDTNAHFIIDPYTRVIKNDSVNKTTIAQYDHNSQRLTFEIPAVDGHSMTLCDLVEIHFINISTDGKNQNPGVYEVDDIAAVGDNAVFTWLISQEATQLAGSLNFFIVFKCTENGVTVYRWGTEICKTLAVSDGMDNGESVLTEYPDILAQWKAQLFDASETAVANVANAEANALANIEAAGEAKKQSVLDSIPDEYEALSDLCDNNYRNKAGAIILETEGKSIVLNDASDYPLQSMSVFGKSTQDGTPTPDAPIDIVSVKNPVVTVCKKNLWNNAECILSNPLLMTKNETGFSFARGNNTNGHSVALRIPLCKGQTVTFSCKGNTFAPSLFIYKEKVYGATVKSGIETLTYTATEDLFEAVFAIIIGSTQGDCEVSNIMVELGFVASEYDPYYGQTLSTTHTLHGIPVSSGGNYTDVDGQQWICDEVDFARGVYVQRTQTIAVTGTENWTEHASGRFYAQIKNSDTYLNKFVLCSHVTHSASSGRGLYGSVGSRGIYFNKNDFYETIDELIAFLNVNSVVFVAVLVTPIETPLSDAEINAFRALRTNKPNTTILNDAGAYMAVEYVADTKTYIDNKFAELG